MLDFEKDGAIEVSDDQLSSISELALRQVELEKQVELLEEDLKALKKRLTQVSAIDLPQKMNEVGLTEIRLKDGRKVSVVHNITASIAAETAPTAMQWLRDNDFGSIIKNEIKAAFGRGEEDRAAELLEHLQETGYIVEHKETVHPQTLKAFVKEQLAEGKEIPRDLFGVFEYDITKVK
jgi:sugar/nucleoside kinase (ribokinase family)